MQTQCPHCDTLFRVTETQINAADGFVRCGVCKEVFNAFDVAAQDQRASVLDEDETTSESTYSHVSNIAAGNDDNEYIEIETASETVYFNELATPALEESEKDTFDFFNEEEELPQHIVPEQFRDTYSSHVVSTLLWSTGILLLTATLIIEYAWFNRHQLQQIPQLQAWTEKLCQRVECKNISVRDPSKIELLTRNIYSHPNKKQALMVNVTMKNNADYAQPYPVMQIDFSDVRGGTVAARRFLPAEYLADESRPGNNSQLPLLESNSSASVTMEIVDPGKQAMTYEFNFL